MVSGRQHRRRPVKHYYGLIEPHLSLHILPLIQIILACNLHEIQIKLENFKNKNKIFEILKSKNFVHFLFFLFFKNIVDT